MRSSYDVLVHIPSLQGGGAERVAVELARYFVTQGWTVAFFVHHPGVDYALPAGIDVLVANQRGHIRRVVELRALLKRVEVRALLSLLPYANLVSLFACCGLERRPRLIVSEHSSYADFRASSVKEHAKFALLALLYRRSDAIVAVSGGVADDLRGRLGPVARSRIAVIHNPCFIADGYVPRLPTNGEDGRTILAVGRLVTQKGFDVLIRAFCRVKAHRPNTRLMIVGEGTERGSLEALIQCLNLGAHVTLPGFTRDIAHAYRQADLFVCSSRVEGFGNVIVEALSFGLPVVSTACRHGPGEILEGGRYGALVPVDDEHALADAMVQALDADVDPLRQVARAREFALDAIGARYADIAGLVA